MRPLVNYCRWQGATLRLRGRDAESVWGELVFGAGTPDERATEFRYDLRAMVITLFDATPERRQQLDEMGVVIG
jgi:hypothetical protein